MSEVFTTLTADEKALYHTLTSEGEDFDNTGRKADELRGMAAAMIRAWAGRDEARCRKCAVEPLDEGIEASATQLAPAEPVFTDTGERFIHFQGKNLPRNTIINLRLSGLSIDSGSLWPILGVIIAIVLVAGMAVFLVRRRRAGIEE